jgi:hypothetical protein
MITLKSSTSDGSEFQVYDDGRLLGRIHLQKGQSGNRYLASIEKDGQDQSNGKVFDSPDDAMRWIERNQGQHL